MFNIENSNFQTRKYINIRVQEVEEEVVGRGGALVELMTFNRRVVGSTPALAATYGPWASPLLTVACVLRWETPIQYPCCSRERLWVVVDLKGRYRNRQNEWMKVGLEATALQLHPWEFHILEQTMVLLMAKVHKHYSWWKEWEEQFFHLNLKGNHGFIKWQRT